MLTAVCLDLMGTVIYDPYVEALQAATGMAPEVLRGVRDPHCWPQFELGAIDEPEFVRRFFPDPDGRYRFDLDAFHRARRDGYRFLPGMADLLDDLDGKVRRYVASNYPVWIDEMAQVFRFDERFEGVYASCHMGVRKPDTGFFEALLEATGHPAQRCLFVDDRPVNCEAAASVGMMTHLFEGVEGLRRRLREEGLGV